MSNAMKRATSNCNAATSLPDIQELETKIVSATAVSFDFFDTLFVRMAVDPEDVFDIIGRRYAIPGFRSKRRAAQAEAFKRMHEENRKEITLAEIYSCLEKLPISSNELLQAEYDIELSIIHPNHELIDVFLTTVKNGVPVVITSDMYLPEQFFLDALHLHDLPAIPIFSSASKNATKRDFGELYDIVAAELGIPHANILHIGDNPQSDIKQAKTKGLETFHYREFRSLPEMQSTTIEASLSRGMLRKHTNDIAQNSPEELGFVYGGPAALGFLDWIADHAQRDKIDRILFLSRDGYNLDRLAKRRIDNHLPNFNYFLGSRTAFTLAAMTPENFAHYLPFLLSGAEGLSPHELLLRIGVIPPSDRVLEDLGIAPDMQVCYSNTDKLYKFLYAYRWEILKTCQRNRRALFLQLRNFDVHQNEKIALVDMGWSGTTQEAFEAAIKGLIDVDVSGYYFCLADTEERKRRSKTQKMSALYSSESAPTGLISQIYKNRTIAELFFSAPHPTVLGLSVSCNGSTAAETDIRNINKNHSSQIAEKISNGMERFVDSFENLQPKIRILSSAKDLANPLIEYITSDAPSNNQLINSIVDFDDWSSTKNKIANISEYI